MANHPNRSRRSPAGAPTPAEIRAARIAADLTQSQAAALVHASLNTWQQWEAPVGSSSARQMHPASWELFRIKTGQVPASP